MLSHEYSINSVYSLSPYDPGSVAVSSSKKSYSRGFLRRLFSCLCNKDAKPPPVKINAPLSLEENGTKVSASFNPPPLLFPEISTFSHAPPWSSLNSMWAAWLAAVWCLKHMFSWLPYWFLGFHVYKSISPGLGEKVLHVQTSIMDL